MEVFWIYSCNGFAFFARLASNKISDIGMMCLSSEGLPHCPSLTTLRSVHYVFSLLCSLPHSFNFFLCDSSRFK